MKKIFFIVPYPLKCAPSQRFRFEQYFSLLKEKGYEFQVANFLNEGNWRDFYHKGKALDKALALVSGIFCRITMLSIVRKFDFIFVHREAMPVGPPVIEWVIAKLFRMKIIYDFDDAIWLTDQQDETFVRRKAKWRSKVGHVCKWAYKVSVGNNYLCNYARKFNSHVVYNPSIVDTINHHNPRLLSRKNDPRTLTIGWTGSHSTIKYLTEIADILKQIEATHQHVRIVIIADRRPETFPLSSFGFIEWNLDTEIQDLSEIDIGLMPLPNDEWAQGKCGFKLIQYMALAIPAVASPVGVNTKLIDHGEDGFLADTPNEWYQYLNQLIVNAPQRKMLGERGRIKIMNQYSVSANAPTFLSLFE